MLQIKHRDRRWKIQGNRQETERAECPAEIQRESQQERTERGGVLLTDGIVVMLPVKTGLQSHGAE